MTPGQSSAASRVLGALAGRATRTSTRARRHGWGRASQVAARGVHALGAAPPPATGGPARAAHHLYLGRDVHAALYMLSFGGLGLGWLRDGVRLGAYLRQAAPCSEERELERRRRELYPRPGVAWLGS